jgi:hypothetical protein
MAKLTKTVVDLSTGITEIVEMTPAEIAQFEATQNEQIAIKEAELAKATATASAVAKLEAIGLTADEIAALRG